MRWAMTRVLPKSSACENEERAVRMKNGLPLFWIEA